MHQGAVSSTTLFCEGKVRLVDLAVVVGCVALGGALNLGARSGSETPRNGSEARTAIAGASRSPISKEMLHSASEILQANLM